VCKVFECCRLCGSEFDSTPKDKKREMIFMIGDGPSCYVSNLVANKANEWLGLLELALEDRNFHS
jgi:hypothetical protein